MQTLGIPVWCCMLSDILCCYIWQMVYFGDPFAKRSFIFEHYTSYYCGLFGIWFGWVLVGTGLVGTGWDGSFIWNVKIHDIPKTEFGRIRWCKMNPKRPHIAPHKLNLWKQIKWSRRWKEQRGGAKVVRRKSQCLRLSCSHDLNTVDVNHA